MNRRSFNLVALTAASFALSWDALADPAPAAPAQGAAAVGGESAASIAGKVQAFYNQANTYLASFKQRYTIYAYNRTKDSSGAVVFAKPGKMRWSYSNNGNVVVSDGKEIKIYERENRQMYQQTVTKTQYPAALAFLMGTGNLQSSFVLKKLDSNKLQFPGGYVLMGTPKDPTPAYQKILFYIDAKTYQVRRVLLIDAQKNRNRFDFVEARVNEKVEEVLFKFTPPPGTNIIRP